MLFGSEPFGALFLFQRCDQINLYMKKLLLLPLLMMVTMAVAQSKIKVYPASVDPNDISFGPYWNDVLSVHMYSMKNMTKAEVFGSESDKVLNTLDNMYFTLFKDHYILWMPEYNFVFNVKPIHDKSIKLGDHLIMMIETLRSYRANNKFHGTN